MNKTEYIIRQLAKTNKKNYENYVVTRIWHLLNNLDIKFVTQQHVTRPRGRALTDMYFPQIQLHIEVNEGHHFDSKLNRVYRDLIRAADIVDATKHNIEEVDVSGKSIESINTQVDAIVVLVRRLIEAKGSPCWDIDAEYNPRTYIDKGSISVSDNVAFRTIADACNCFGHNYIGYQRAFARHGTENRMIWFPKLYENEEWLNEISLDEQTIIERKKSGHENYFSQAITQPDNLKERLTFARVRSNLGDVMYRFKGVYQLNVDESKKLEMVVYKRTAITVKTYDVNS